MSKVVSKQEEKTFNPTSYDVSDWGSSYYQNPGNALYGTSSTSYARFTLRNTSYVAYYFFDVSNIPNNAELISVECKVKGYVSNSSYYPQIRLYSGDTAKGSATSITSTTSGGTIYTLNVGNWTLEELTEAKLAITVYRQSTQNSRYAYIYGADLIITYSYNDTVFEITSTLSTNKVSSINPAGVTEVSSGDNYELIINANSLDDVKIEDNGTDVTSQIIRHDVKTFVESYPASYTTGGNWSNGSNRMSECIGESAETTNTSASASNYATSGNTAYADYTFDFSDIPSNAEITSITVKCKGKRESNTTDSTHVAKIQLYSGDTVKGSAEEFSSTSVEVLELSNVGTWTRSELNDAKLRFTVAYYGGIIYGATWTVNYSVPDGNQYYWTYTLTNVNDDHLIVVSDSIIEIPDEDPTLNYYSLTISSINAITTPGRGTIRVEEGSNKQIVIEPSETQLTLITDNGVDITNQLVLHSGGSPTYTVNNIAAADYYFNLNSTTGYYVSNNDGVSTSAALARINFSLPVKCLVTIQYINYSEATYDYGIFGNIDSSLGTSYSVDSNAYKILSADSDNTSTPQTLTYEIEAGEHFIDVKYRKDQYTDDNYDNLQFKVLSVTELESNNYYTYDLTNITQDHSLIFIFGDVTYYFVNSSGTNAKLFPSGSLVYLPDDVYTLTIVPNDYSYNASIIDNNVDVSSSLERKEQVVTKDGITTTVVNYIYKINSVNQNHNLVINCFDSSNVFIKLNGEWITVNKIYKKVNDRWEEQPMTLDLNKVYKTKIPNS